MTLPDGPAELPGAEIAKVALLTPEQPDNTNQPWYGDVSTGECSKSRCQPAGVALTIPPAPFCWAMVTMAIRVSPVLQVVPRLAVMLTVDPTPPEPWDAADRTRVGVAAAARDSWRMFTVGSATRSATTHRIARRRAAPRRPDSSTGLI